MPQVAKAMLPFCACGVPLRPCRVFPQPPDVVPVSLQHNFPGHPERSEDPMFLVCTT